MRIGDPEGVASVNENPHSLTTEDESETDETQGSIELFLLEEVQALGQLVSVS